MRALGGWFAPVWLGRTRAAVLHHGERLTMANSVIAHANSGETGEDVELMDATDALAMGGFDSVDVLKLDTEGCEVEIVERLLESGDLTRVSFVLLEYHHERDRRRLDDLLGGAEFVQFGAHATQPHRGTVKFVARAVAASFENGWHAGKPIG